MRSDVDPEILTALIHVFGESNVLYEWNVGQNSRDYLQYLRQYCPRVDFAVKPLNISDDDGEISIANGMINDACAFYKRLIDSLRSKDEELERAFNLSEASDAERLRLERIFFAFEPNENPRCFLVIEKEKETEQKPVLGSIVNASALGKIGIMVADDSDNDKRSQYRRLIKIRKYLRFTTIVKKTGKVANNSIVLPKEEFLHILRNHPNFDE